MKILSNYGAIVKTQEEVSLLKTLNTDHSTLQKRNNLYFWWATTEFLEAAENLDLERIQHSIDRGISINTRDVSITTPNG